MRYSKDKTRKKLLNICELFFLYLEHGNWKWKKTGKNFKKWKEKHLIFFFLEIFKNFNKNIYCKNFSFLFLFARRCIVSAWKNGMHCTLNARKLLIAFLEKSAKTNQNWNFLFISLFNGFFETVSSTNWGPFILDKIFKRQTYMNIIIIYLV